MALFVVFDPLSVEPERLRAQPALGRQQFGHPGAARPQSAGEVLYQRLEEARSGFAGRALEDELHGRLDRDLVDRRIGTGHARMLPQLALAMGAILRKSRAR